MIDRLTAKLLKSREALRKPEIWLLILILIAFAIRFGSIDFQSLWRDEVDAIRFGRDLSAEIDAALLGGGAGSMIDKLRDILTRPGFNGPLYFLTLERWSRAAGDTGFALRAFSALFGILTIPLIYALAKRLFRAAHIDLLAAWLMTISAYFVWYSQEAKMYTEITALALAAVYGLRRAVDTPAGQRAWPWWLLTIAATTLAMYSHILAALLIGVEVVLFLLWWPAAKQHWKGGLISLAALTLPYLPLALWQIGLALTPGDQGHTFYRFDEIVRVLMTGFTNGILPFDAALNAVNIRSQVGDVTSAISPAGWGAWLLSVLTIIGALMWKGRGDRADRLGLVAWALLPVAAIAIVSLNRPVFTDRYLIWIGPAVYLLAALGTAELWKWRRIAGGAALAVLSMVAMLGLYAQASIPFKSDFRSAARFVQQHYQGDEIVVFQIPYGRYIFDYYFEPAFRSSDGPYTNQRNPDGSFAQDAASIDAGIANALSGQKAAWLVATEVEMWDERHLLEEWLKRNARETDRGEFMRVSVVRYDLTP